MRYRPSLSSSSMPSLALLLLLLVWLPITPTNSQPVAGLGVEVPESIHLKAGVLNAYPFAGVEEVTGGGIKYSGFEVDLLKRMQVFARMDNVTLTFDMSPSPTQYGAALDLVANDCNTTYNPKPLEECEQFDLIVGDYYCNPQRSVRVDFTPSWLRTTMSTIKLLDKKGVDYTTLTQASRAKATVCVPQGAYLTEVVMGKFPEAEYVQCESFDQCIDWLKEEKCVLFSNDELLLRYQQSIDPSLEVTREQFNTQYLVWPMKYSLPPVTSILFKKWMYSAVSNATLDELFFSYFQKQLCPVGTAGRDCELPCDPDHGTADARGVCVCESVRFTGPDCSIEVEEEVNLIPHSLKLIAYAMFGLNAIVILICGLWLAWQRDSAQVRVSQPSFLLLVLVGCIISSSTIIVMAQEDSGDGPVPACMAIPWLYSVGFSITFGTLFAKIRRVYLIFMQAAQTQTGAQSRKNRVTFRETLSVIGLVLAIDVLILVVWTLVDPLEWQRTVITADQFGFPLESEGFCVSEHWSIFAGVIAALHLILLGVACFMCYVARDIPTKFSEGKYLAIATISNLQIFVVAVPILIILGPDPQTSFFVRSVIIWMNDLAVVTLIFGNLMYSVHFEKGDQSEKVKAAVGQAINRYSQVQKNTSSGEKPTSMSFKEGSQVLSHSNSHQAPPPSKHNRKDDPNRKSKSRRKSGVLSNSMTHSGMSHSGHKANRRHSSHHTRNSVGSRMTGPSLVSWADVNESVHERNDDVDEDTMAQESFMDEGDTACSEDNEPPRESAKKPKDVLKSRDTWGGCNISTFEQQGSALGAVSDESVDSRSALIPEPEPEPAPAPAKRESTLAPAALPKARNPSSTYAQSRISQIRGKHAEIVALRKSANRGNPMS